MTDLREAKLPGWARETIGQLRTEVADLNCRLAVFEERSALLASPFMLDRWHEKSRRTFLPSLTRLSYVGPGYSLTLSEAEPAYMDRCLQVMLSTDQGPGGFDLTPFLGVIPSASNVLYLRPLPKVRR